MVPQKYTEARKAGNKKWDSANLDRLSLALPKGYKDLLKAEAEKNGESVNGFIKMLIDMYVDRENSNEQ